MTIKSLKNFNLNKINRFILLLALLAYACTGYAQVNNHFTHEDTLRGALNPLRLYDVKYYDLHLYVNTVDKTVSGENKISFLAQTDLDSIQIDFAAGMQVIDVQNFSYLQANKNFETKFNSLKFSRAGDRCYVKFPKKVKKDSLLAINVIFYGKPRAAVKAPWDGGFVWKKDADGNTWLGTACEGIGASLWWPCKDYLGDEPDSMRITCLCDTNLFCKANGQLESVKDIEIVNDKINPDHTIILKQYEWLVSYPINTYDVTINLGNYGDIKDSFYSKSGKLALHFYPLKEHQAQAHAYFPTRTKQMLKCFEHYFGPYPFFKDGYSLVETNYWGMEHQSAIAYGNHFKDSTLGYNFDFILIHESAHEWCGNSLSCTDEAEMWLHESFATYAEALYVEYFWGKEAGTAYLLKQKNRISNTEPMIGPMGVNYHQRKDNDIYYKGAWMLHTLRNVINNDSLFFAIIYNYACTYKCSPVHTYDFINIVNKMTGKDYSTFFKQYLYHAALPVLEYRIKNKSNKYIFSYHWIGVDKNFEMPITISADGKIQKIKVSASWKHEKLMGTSDKFLIPENFTLFTLNKID